MVMWGDGLDGCGEKRLLVDKDPFLNLRDTDPQRIDCKICHMQSSFAFYVPILAYLEDEVWKMYCVNF